MWLPECINEEALSLIIIELQTSFRILPVCRQHQYQYVDKNTWYGNNNIVGFYQRTEDGYASSIQCIYLENGLR